MSTAIPAPPCRFYAKGLCKFGTQCKKSHAGPVSKSMSVDHSSTDISIIQGASVPPANPSSPTLVEAVVQPTRVQSVSAQSKLQAPKVSRRRKNTCFAWKKGKCAKGDKCQYAHDPATQGVHLKSPMVNSEVFQQLPGDECHDRDHQTEAFETLQEAFRLESEAKGLAAKAERARKEEDKRKRTEEAKKRIIEQERRIREEEARRQRIEAEQRAREEEAIRQRIAAEQRAREATRRRIEAEQRAREEEEATRKRIAAERRAREEEERRVRLEEIYRQEAAFVLQKVVQGSIVTFAAGLDVRGVITGFESCRITVKNIPNDAREAEIVALFTQQGLDISRFYVEGSRPIAGGKQEVNVVTDAESGSAIAAGLDEIPFHNERLSFDVGVFNDVGGMGAQSSWDADVVVVSFRAPSVRYVVELPEETIATKIRQLNGRTCCRRQVKVERNTPPPGRAIISFRYNSIKISNLPMDVSDDAVVEFTGSIVVRKLKTPNFTDLDTALNLLRDCISRHVPGQLVSFDTTSRGDGNGVASVRVRLSTHEVARSVYDLLDGKRLNYIGMVPWLRLRDPLLFTITIPHGQYRAQRSQWDELRGSITDKKACNLQIHEQSSVVRIQLAGSVKAAIGALKVRVENLAAGERVEGWHPSLAGQNKDFLQRIIQSGAFFKSDSRRQILTLYGKSREVDVARRIVAEELERLSTLDWSTTLPRHSIGLFVRQGLAALREIFGEDSVQLDAARRQLTIRGSEEARHHVNRLIEESKQAQRIVTNQPEGTNVCPICTDTVSSPHKLGCGHEYCTACLRHFLTTAVETKSFPLVCVGSDSTCAVPIPIPLIQRFLTPAAFGLLVEEVFNTYISQHPLEIKNCTTPACTQIYRRNAAAAVIQCPSCFVELCSACSKDGHAGQTCAEYKARYDPEEQERLSEQWIASQTGFKNCPRCTRLLEKDGGCNHMSCPCGAHICWRCVKVFPSEVIYSHMREAHGGLYTEEEPAAAPAQQPQAAPQYDPFQGVDYLEQARLIQQAEARRRLNLGVHLNEAQRPRFQPQPDYDGFRRAREAYAYEQAREERERWERERARVEREQRERERAEREQADRGWGCCIM